MGSLQLPAHFNWVAHHEGFKKAFQDWLDAGSFNEIRVAYSNAQNHNPDARELFAGLSNGHIKQLIDAL